MANSKQNYLKENETTIVNWLNVNTPLSEIARNLSIKYDTLKRYLDKNKICYTTNQNRKGKPHAELRKPASYYIENDVLVNAHTLRKKLIEDGLKEYKCECCGMSEWLGKPIPLELHHINGNHYDNHFENLEILCCNCHGQKHSYGETIGGESKKSVVKEKKIKRNISGYCEICGKPLYDTSLRYCSQKCSHKAHERLAYCKELIITTLKENGTYLKSGKVLGISDKTFKKWCDKYGITKDSIL